MVPVDSGLPILQKKQPHLLEVRIILFVRWAAGAPGAVAVKIQKGTYKGQDQDAWTISDNNMLVASSKLSDDLVYKITKAIYETPKPFKKLAWLKKMSWKTATKGVPIPFHPGAARYYKEKGINVRAE